MARQLWRAPPPADELRRIGRTGTVRRRTRFAHCSNAWAFKVSEAGADPQRRAEDRPRSMKASDAAYEDLQDEVAGHPLGARRRADRCHRLRGREPAE